MAFKDLPLPGGVVPPVRPGVLVHGGLIYLESDRIQDQINNCWWEKPRGSLFSSRSSCARCCPWGSYRKKATGFGLIRRHKGLRLPSTIQDIIMSRVDALPESAREILRIGSAIEREFDYHLLKMVSDHRKMNLQRGIAALREAEFIYQRGVIPEATFIFRHALTLETLHGSMLTAQKKELHRKIGEALEALYAAGRMNIVMHSPVILPNAACMTKSPFMPRLQPKSAEDPVLMRMPLPIQNSIDALGATPCHRGVQKKIIDARVKAVKLFYSAEPPRRCKKGCRPNCRHSVIAGLPEKSSSPFILHWVHIGGQSGI
jgi:hypothetical protein